jgi:hypothetical protein
MGDSSWDHLFPSLLNRERYFPEVLSERRDQGNFSMGGPAGRGAYTSTATSNGPF